MLLKNYKLSLQLFRRNFFIFISPASLAQSSLFFSLFYHSVTKWHCQPGIGIFASVSVSSLLLHFSISPLHLISDFLNFYISGNICQVLPKATLTSIIWHLWHLLTFVCNTTQTGSRRESSEVGQNIGANRVAEVTNQPTAHLPANQNVAQSSLTTFSSQLSCQAKE